MEPARKRIKLEDEPSPQRLPSPELSLEEIIAAESRCQECPLAFNNIAELYRHISKYHYNKYVCKACDEGCQDKKQFAQGIGRTGRREHKTRNRQIALN
ncbi:hypothetical protein NW766_004544 [Fusarium irregulare]|uniref:C2H2-type domain-containing protein n=1 Tax=Fusarium irregulare TaxID=2494466 RepID=A0A9W8PRV5_9HYPO|nr:hypothetical protein NW766_004544 [Fusarium irregulare]